LLEGLNANATQKTDAITAVDSNHWTGA